LLAVLAVVAAAAVGSYFIFPDEVKPLLQRAGTAVDNWVGKKVSGDDGTPQAPSTQAHFTNIDGQVRVKRVADGKWVKADYSLPLEQGDVVQTMSDGIAKLAFADGSSYIIQQDSLVTIEESTTNAAQQNVVGMRVNTGDIMLNTGEVPSTHQVEIDQTSTTLGKDSALLASNRGTAPAIEVTKGKGEMKIGGETVAIAPYEKVTINPEDQTFTKKKEVEPPVLLAPANMMNIIVPANARNVELSWVPVDGVSTYRVRLSRNPYFSSIEKQVPVNGTSVTLLRLDPGQYYWAVQSQDAQGRFSIDSDKSAFTVIDKGADGVSLALEISQLIQHQHVIEIKGSTQNGARVMVNGQQVPVIAPDGSFTYFTPPLPSGENVITVTAQNEKGGVNTKTEKVVIQ
jgi:hypothetical protein